MKSLLKNDVQEKLSRDREKSRVLEGAVKHNLQRTPCGEGADENGLTVRDEAGANRIRYPSSPGCKLCELGVAYSSGYAGRSEGVKLAVWKYGRKTEIKGIGGEHYKGCGVRFNLIQRRKSHQ